jgi:hypothetical protein
MKTGQIIDDLSFENLVVDESSIIPSCLVTSIISTDLSNSLPINQTFYQKDKNHYAILENHKQLWSNGLHLHLSQEGLINKITLIDFPLSQYILQLNGHNSATAIYNSENGHFEFDFTKSMSKTLDDFNSITRSSDEPNIKNRQQYVNFDRIDQIRIIIPKGLQLNQKHTYSFHGFFKVKDQWIECDKEFVLYPYNTHSLFFNHVTESIDLKVNKNDGTIIVYVNHTELCRFKTTTNLTRITFANPNQILKGRQNQYLSDEINQKSLNMSRVYKFDVVVLDCQLLDVRQNFYAIYNYPERMRMFDN